MIHYLTKTGALIAGTRIDSKEYRSMYSKFTLEQMCYLVDYIYKKVAYVGFSVTTLFPNPWSPELEVIFGIFKDEQLSREFLGCLVFNLMVDDARTWFATKSQLPNLAHRDYETMFYAPHQGVKSGNT